MTTKRKKTVRKSAQADTPTTQAPPAADLPAVPPHTDAPPAQPAVQGPQGAPTTPAPGPVNPHDLVCPKCGGKGTVQWLVNVNGTKPFEREGPCHRCRVLRGAGKGFQDGADLLRNRHYDSNGGKAVRFVALVVRTTPDGVKRTHEIGFGVGRRWDVETPTEVFVRTPEGKYDAKPASKLQKGDVIVVPTAAHTPVEVQVEAVRDLAQEVAA